MAKKKGEEPENKSTAMEGGGMANSLIKGLAWTLGGGLAVGLGIKIGQSSAPPLAPAEAVDFGPVLDRIEGVESRIGSVESAHAEAIAQLKEAGPMIIPSVHELEQQVQAQSNQVEALRAEIARAARKSDERIDDLGYSVNSLESKIPGLIEQSMKPKFDELHERVQREMAETASQTLEVFADRIQARVVEKISSIEGDLARQSENIKDLRDYSLKTDQNLQRLLVGVESLADKINRKFEAPVEQARVAPPPPRTATLPPPVQAPSTGGAPLAPPAVSPQPATESRQAPPAPPTPTSQAMAPAAAAPALAPKPTILPPPAQPVKAPDFPAKIELGDADDVRPPREAFLAPKAPTRPEFEDLLADSPRSNGLRRAAIAGGSLLLAAAVFGGVELSGILQRPASAHADSKTVGSAVSGDTLDTRKLTDQSDLLDQARGFNQKKEYAKAEEIYRKILKNDPSNVEVKRLLASALFRQEKIEESAKVIDSIEKQGSETAPQ
jgi:hypothetical protein